MDVSAVVMMVVGILIIWGGLALSIINAVSTSKNKS
ncbi:Putative methionine and alanine importer, small subunit [Evansella caseinilytica]|uniref:Putative methionine and alanine importer, small subunit n=1 Tax=Evansella caseinilytica TaxID=1503961 RepID=A0A1H3UCY5_9BACI|nr:methionine/alanine import family NSS transporter small subunit [Evansella caseinilytica]SDZ60228.1 Putative methionine and alanine importer, small subunit [Evansella caseinilytica]